MSNYDSDEDLIQENLMIEKYVNDNPYPSYKMMCERLRNNNAIELYAEYGEENHKLLKICYDNITNKKICKSAGQKIYNRGGHESMAKNYYTLKLFSPFAESSNTTIRSYGGMLNHWWDGVGTWQH